jgi:hypothetical protein
VNDMRRKLGKRFPPSVKKGKKFEGPDGIIGRLRGNVRDHTPGHGITIPVTLPGTSPIWRPILSSFRLVAGGTTMFRTRRTV